MHVLGRYDCDKTAWPTLPMSRAIINVLAKPFQKASALEWPQLLWDGNQGLDKEGRQLERTRQRASNP